jgi:hypothetical protein
MDFFLNLHILINTMTNLNNILPRLDRPYNNGTVYTLTYIKSSDVIVG